MKFISPLHLLPSILCTLFILSIVSISHILNYKVWVGIEFCIWVRVFPLWTSWGQKWTIVHYNHKFNILNIISVYYVLFPLLIFQDRIQYWKVINMESGLSLCLQYWSVLTIWKISLFIKKIGGPSEVVILTVYLNLPRFVDVAVVGATRACWSKIK